MAYFTCGQGTSLTIQITSTPIALYGYTITISKNGTIIGTTTFDNTGNARYKVEEAGTYTVSVTYGGTVYTENVTVTDRFETSIVDIPDGKTVLPVNDIQTWLKCADIWNKNYTTLDEVLADSTTLLALISSNNAVDYLVRSHAWAENPGLVPTMTSNTLPYGEVISSNNGNSDYWLFNGVTETSSSTGQWRPSSGKGTDCYIGYGFTEKKRVEKVQIWIDSYSCTYNTISVKIQGSDDKMNWHDISSTMSFGGDFNTAASFRHTNYVLNLPDYDGEYQYYRIYFLSDFYRTSTSYAVPTEIQFYEHSYTKAIPENATAMTYIGANDYCAETLLADGNQGLVPIMTSDTTPSGTCFSSSYSAASRAAYKAFDGDDTTYAESNTNAFPYMLGYTFTNDVCVKKVFIKSYYNGSSYIKDFKIQGSNDGFASDIHDLYSGSFAATESEKTIVLENTEEYTSYRVNAQNTQSGKQYVTIYTIQFYAKTASWLEPICNSTYFESVLNVKVPTMTSATEPSGIVSSSSNYASSKMNYMAFDGVTSTTWQGAGGIPQWIQYQFENPVKIKKVSALDAHGPKVSKVQASNDGSEWTDLGDFVNVQSANWVSAAYENETKYSYYRLYVTDCNYTYNNVKYVILQELQFYGRE